MTTNGIMNLEDARAVAAILRAAEIKAPVARLNGVRVLIGQASYISRADGRSPGAAQDVRDLYLYVQDTRDVQPRGIRAWLIRDLVTEYRTGAFVTDFDRDAFEAVSGQAAVPASVAAFEAASARPEPEGKPDFWQIMRAMPELTPDQHAELAGPELIEAARKWIADCEWADNIDADELTPGQVQAGITRHYAGGWAQFLRDSR